MTWVDGYDAWCWKQLHGNSPWDAQLSQANAMVQSAAEAQTDQDICNAMDKQQSAVASAAITAWANAGTAAMGSQLNGQLQTTLDAQGNAAATAATSNASLNVNVAAGDFTTAAQTAALSIFNNYGTATMGAFADVPHASPPVESPSTPLPPLSPEASKSTAMRQAIADNTPTLAGAVDESFQQKGAMLRDGADLIAYGTLGACAATVFPVVVLPTAYGAAADLCVTGVNTARAAGACVAIKYGATAIRIGAQYHNYLENNPLAAGTVQTTETVWVSRAAETAALAARVAAATAGASPPGKP